MRTRTLWLLAVSTAVTGLVLAASPLVGHHDVRRAASRLQVAPAAGSTLGHARAVLRRWDHRRAVAWADADPSLLRSLYVDGSQTGRRDLAMLAAYRRRGLRVTRMTRQVLGLGVAAARGRRLTLLVTDRLVDARVVGHDIGAIVPERCLARWRIRMVHTATGWRVVEVDGPHPAR